MPFRIVADNDNPSKPIYDRVEAKMRAKVMAGRREPDTLMLSRMTKAEVKSIMTARLNKIKKRAAKKATKVTRESNE